MTPTVSVVVLSYNRPECLREALASVAAQTLAPTEVIVVDNRSPRSDEVARLVAGFAGVRLIAHQENRGFTGGMNAGLGAAVGEYVLLTEDDMVLRPDCLAAFVGHAAAGTEAGLSSGVIRRRSNGKVQYAGGDLSLGGVFRLTIRGEGADAAPGSAPYPVGYITGAMVFSRRDYLHRLGGFRDEFFMYLEDVDLSLRAARAGRPPVIVPAAVAEHLDTTGPVSDVVRFHKVKNLVAVYLLHAPLHVLPEFVARYGVGMIARLAIWDRRGAWIAARGWWAALRRVRALWRDRRAGHPGVPC